MDPAMRQNFAYAFAETHNLNLEVCHKEYGVLLFKLHFKRYKKLQVRISFPQPNYIYIILYIIIKVAPSFKLATTEQKYLKLILSQSDNQG